jgi:S-adenosylmethionine hydrolase
MTGAIARISPETRCLDLSHGIAPQDIWAGRFCLLNAAPYFPSPSVFLGVVDPGVGSQRRGIAVAFQAGFFVGPDNGLVSGLLDLWGAIAAVELTNPKYWRTTNPAEISQTFHGRDIFAPVAAHLSLGVPLENLGTVIATDSLVRLAIPPHQQMADRIIGTVQHIDHFGNLITTIPHHLGGTGCLLIGDRPLPWAQTYSDVPPQSPCILRGSHGWLEISINQGNAQQIFNIKRGQQIVLMRH